MNNYSSIVHFIKLSQWRFSSTTIQSQGRDCSLHSAHNKLNQSIGSFVDFILSFGSSSTGRNLGNEFHSLNLQSWNILRDILWRQIISWTYFFCFRRCERTAWFAWRRLLTQLRMKRGKLTERLTRRIRQFVTLLLSDVPGQNFIFNFR